MAIGMRAPQSLTKLVEALECTLDITQIEVLRAKKTPHRAPLPG